MAIESLIVNFVFLGSLYALIAMGFTLIFSVGGVMNFAYGGQITFGAFLAYIAMNDYGVGTTPALVSAVVGSAVLGMLLYGSVIRFVQHDTLLTVVISFVVGFGIQQTLRVLVENGPITIPQIVGGSIPIGGFDLRFTVLFIMVSAFGMIVSTIYLLNHTKIGKGIIALSFSKKGAQLAGINPTKLELITWGIAGTFAGFAGVALVSFEGGNWFMGTDPMILAFAIVILGGLGSVRGAVVAAFVIAGMEILVRELIDPSLVGITALVMVIAVLSVKPEGFFGRGDTV